MSEPETPPTSEARETFLPADEQKGTEWYRLMLWAMPSCLLLSSSFGWMILADHFKFLRSDTAWVWGALTMVVMTWMIGCFDAKLRFGQCGAGPRKLVVHACRFLGLQLLVAPPVALVAGFAISLQ